MQLITLLLIIGYLFGSIPFGKLAGKAVGIDIQKRGSGNIGFANAVRVLGWRLGLLVLIGDVLKGLIPTYFAMRISNEHTALFVGVAAIMGHVYPIWLKFKGGKAIATGLGVSFVIFPSGALLGLATYCLFFAIFRKSDISSLAGAWALASASVILSPNLAVYFIGITLFAMYTHRNNIRSYVRIIRDRHGELGS